MWWPSPLAKACGGLLSRAFRSEPVVRRLATMRVTDMPSAGVYDALVARALTGFYEKVAGELAAACPSGRGLEVGCGPGHLATRLAALEPDLEITGLDVDPEMVQLAARRAARAGLANRTWFQVADVAALPFADASFDLVYSTASAHHWEDVSGGLTEVFRVLKPGGEAWIYDLAARLLGHAHGRAELERLAATSPFASGIMEPFPWPGSIRIMGRMRLRRPAPRT